MTERGWLEFIMDEFAILFVLWGMAIALFLKYAETENYWYLLAWVPFGFFAFMKLIAFYENLKYKNF